MFRSLTLKRVFHKEIHCFLPVHHGGRIPHENVDSWPYGCIHTARGFDQIVSRMEIGNRLIAFRDYISVFCQNGSIFCYGVIAKWAGAKSGTHGCTRHHTAPWLIKSFFVSSRRHIQVSLIEESFSKGNSFFSGGAPCR